MISEHGPNSSYEGKQRAANRQDSYGVFSGIYMVLDG